MWLIYCVIYLLNFCLLYENVMVKLCNIQCYVLFVCVLNLVSHVKETID